MSTRLLALVTAALVLGTFVQVRADEFKPGYLQLTQLDAETYDVLWKVPAIDESTTLKAKPLFPEGTEALTPVHATYRAGCHGAADGASACPPDSTARRSLSRNCRKPGSMCLARLVRLDGSVQLERILPVSPGVRRPGQSRSVGSGEDVHDARRRTHPVGFDHLLFVLALVLLVQGTSRLLWTITAFTAAHSLTLAGATLGWVHVPGPPVEASIALSIVFVAAEIAQARHGRRSLTQQYPWVVAFTFGLLHGFGFAGALAEVGLPVSSIAIALLFFNVGVEIGQLLFVGGVLLTIAASWRIGQRLPASPSNRLWRVAPYAIGGLASFWVIERVAAF